MTPLQLSAAGGSPESPPPSQSGDRPQRSRNAKAQARHRAKRKAYIEQLEQTVTKLQYALSLSSDQVAVLPPPMARIRELEMRNNQLLRQIDEMQAQLAVRDRLRIAEAAQRSHNDSVLSLFNDRDAREIANRRRTVMPTALPCIFSLSRHSTQQRTQDYSPLPTAVPSGYLPYSPHAHMQHHSPLSSYTLQYPYPESQQQEVLPGNAPSATSSSPEGTHLPPMHAQYTSPMHDYACAHPSAMDYHPYVGDSPPCDGAVKIEEDADPVYHTNMTENPAASTSLGSHDPALDNWHGYDNVL